MGRRSATETVAKLIVAFLQRATWRQKDLEVECGVGARSVRKALIELSLAGVPLEREEEFPHVFWSVPSAWPGGRSRGIEREDLARVARLVARLPRSRERELALAKLVTPALCGSVTPNSQHDPVREHVLQVLEDGVQSRTPVRMAYYSASRGVDSVRTTSVQRIAYGDFPRFVGFCHDSERLKWFRADRVKSARLEAAATFHSCREDELDAFLRESMDGFRSGEGVVTCEFVVRTPEARWALALMPVDPAAALVTPVENGSDVVLRTSATEVLARFLVGLGGAARVIGPASLRDRVVALAGESLLANGVDVLNTGSAKPIRSARPDRIVQAPTAQSVAMKPRARDS